METPYHLVLVDDDHEFRRLLAEDLRRRGFSVDAVADAAALDGVLAQRLPDLIVLDWMLPGEDGPSVLRRLRANPRTQAVPVLMLTARSDDFDRVFGLEVGADDYLTKPFHPEELALRIQALLRRAHGLANQPQLEAAGLQLDESRQCVTAGGEAIDLTAAEFRLLRYFMLHPGQILSKSHLADHLYDGETERDSNVIEVHVNRLRGKLGRNVIETRRGQGYRFTGEQG